MVAVLNRSIALLSLGVFLAVAGGCLRGIVFNASESAPRGFYLVAPAGPYAALCPSSAVSRRYRGAGSCPDGYMPILKRIASTPGDLIETSPAGIRRNGALLAATAPRPQDPSGRPLDAYAYGVYRVGSEEVWLVSNKALGYDSRYFGPVRLAAIRARLDPIWTW